MKKNNPPSIYKPLIIMFICIAVFLYFDSKYYVEKTNYSESGSSEMFSGFHDPLFSHSLCTIACFNISIVGWIIYFIDCFEYKCRNKQNSDEKTTES